MPTKNSNTNDTHRTSFQRRTTRHPRLPEGWTLLNDERPDWDHPRRSELQDAWYEWLNANGPWYWFLTLTFLRDVKVETARAKFRKLKFSLIDALRSTHERQGVTDKRELKRKCRLTYALATEWSPIAHRLHLHILCRAQGLDLLHPHRWEKRWMSPRIGGGAAMIKVAERTDMKKLVSYTVKGGHLDVGGPLNEWTCLPPRSASSSDATTLAGAQSPLASG